MGGVPAPGWGWPNPWHQTRDRQDQQQLIGHISSQPRGREHHTAPGNIQDLSLGTQWTTRGLWEISLEVSRGWGDPWFLQEDVLGCLECFLRLAGNWNSLFRDKQDLAWPHDEEICLARGPWPHEQSEERLWHQAVWCPPGFPRWQGILNIRPSF